MNSELKKAAAWAESVLTGLRYGTVKIEIVVHDGKVSLLRKGVEEATKPSGGGDE